MDQRSRSGIALACIIVFGIVATCAKEACPRFEPFQHGRVWYTTDRIEVETIAIFKCDEGADFFNSESYSVCFEDAEWTNYPVCKRRCEIPEIPHGRLEFQNGSIAKGEITHDLQVKLVCDDIYRLEEKKNRNIKCKDGNIQVPKCLPNFCSRPAVQNTVLERNMTKFQHSFETYIICNEGFEFPDGSKKKLVTCSFGNWSPIPPRCVERKCFVSQIQGIERLSVFKKRNHKLQEHQTVSSRQKVYLRCKEGYKANRTRGMGIKCLKGVWLGSLGCSRRIKYRVRTTTGSKRGAGTDSDIYLKMFGENGLHTKEIELTKDIHNTWNKFENGDTDEFHVYLTDVGNISHIEIRMDGKFTWRGEWFLQFVSIYDSAMKKYYGFPVGQWISSRNEVKKLQINGGSEQRQCGDTFTDGHILRPEGLASLYQLAKDDVTCNMLCIERGSGCHATIYFERMNRCYAINRKKLQSMENFGGGGISFRRFCYTD